MIVKNDGEVGEDGDEEEEDEESANVANLQGGEKTTGEYHVRNEEMTVLGDVTEGNDEG